MVDHGFFTHNFVVSNQKWGGSQSLGSAGGIVTYSYATTTYADQFLAFQGFITQTPFQTDITRAFANWEDVANIRFELVSDAPNVDIRFGWATIDGSSGVLGDATIPSAGPLGSVIVRFDQEENWITGGNATLPAIDFLYTATHEIGHAIGILHSDMPDSLMFDAYNETTRTLQSDDVAAGVNLYGESNIEKVDVFRFFRTDTGGHFFTPNQIEKESLEIQDAFLAEGIGFEALGPTADNVDSSIPIYRFFNTVLGSHFYTADESEKDAVMEMQDMLYEDVGFRAFSSETASTDPVYRFFNTGSGGHFYTIDANEKDIVMEIESLRFEGVGFYAYQDM
ncbi:matrixin family metalloprotease [Alphaproteobacteria bacterium]|nr:matrixin family metalloprotease [Alphaproteobacteria bacterium]